MTFIGSDNAIAWAHFRLRGGWRQSLRWAVGFFILATIAAFFMVRGDPINSGRTLWGWATGMLALNAALLVIYTSARIGTAVKQDILTRMVESHRLMPVPATHVIAGYIAGAAMQPLILSFAVFVFGGLCAVGAHVDVQRWIMANLVLLVFSGFAWVLAAFLGFQKKGMNLLAFLPILFPSITGGGLFLLPGVLVLLSPIVGNSVFKLTATATDFPWIFIVCFVAQAYFAAICFVGAARRYRDPSAVGLTPALGLAVVLGWVAITWIAMVRWEDMHPMMFGRMRRNLPEMQAAASMIVAMVLSLLPISAAARAVTRHWQSRFDPGADPGAESASGDHAFAVLLAVAFAAVAPVFIPVIAPQLPALAHGVLIRIVLILAMFATGYYFLFRVIYRSFDTAAGAGFVWLLMTWGLPIAIDLLRYSMATAPDAQPMGTASASSPAGALVLLLSHSPLPTTPGMIIQFIVMLIPIALYTINRLAPAKATAQRDDAC
jgi:hypothetical protein